MLILSFSVIAKTFGVLVRGHPCARAAGHSYSPVSRIGVKLVAGAVSAGQLFHRAVFGPEALDGVASAQEKIFMHFESMV